MVRAARARRRERRSRAVRETPDSASRGRRGQRRAGMTGPTPDAEPAGGTTTRSSAGRAGSFCFEDRRCRICRRPIRRTMSRARSTSAGSRRTCSPPTAPARPPTRRCPPFTIIQPPPNITGSLHLGHAQRTAVEDLMIRHARMRGHRALFLPGLDHASIAAQFVLDGILAKEGESRASRSAASATSSGCASSWPRPATSCSASSDGSAASFDWGRLRYTMDDGSAQRRPGRLRAALPRRTWPTGPRRSSTGARAAGRA